MEKKIKFPAYAWIGGVGKCAMRLVQNSPVEVGRKLPRGTRHYWRDGGMWGTDAKFIDGKLTTCGHSGDFSYLNGKEVIECSKKEWKKDNGEYV